MSSPTVHWASLFNESTMMLLVTLSLVIVDKQIFYCFNCSLVGWWRGYDGRVAADGTIIQDVSQADYDQNWIISLAVAGSGAIQKWNLPIIMSILDLLIHLIAFLQHLLCLHLVICPLLIVGMDINVYIPHKTTSKYQTTSIILDTVHSGLMILL